MSPQEAGRSGVVESEAARLRLRLLEAYWGASGLTARERRARLDDALQESAAHLEPATRERVVEQVLDELARWSPPEEPAAAAGGGDLARTLVACLVGEGAAGGHLSAEETRLVECVRVMADHLQMVSLNHIEFMKKIARRHTSFLPAAFREELKNVLTRPDDAESPARLEEVKELLHKMELTRNVFFSGARAAAALALKRLIQDLNPSRAGEGKGTSKRAWEELERTYEMMDALPPEALCDRYFSEIYKNEINEKVRV